MQSPVMNFGEYTKERWIYYVCPNYNHGGNRMDTIALILSIVGSLNWGLVALFKFDLVAWIFGGQGALVSRIIYTLVAICGIWLISLFFRQRETSAALE